MFFKDLLLLVTKQAVARALILFINKQAVARALTLFINKQAVVNPLTSPVRKFPGPKIARRHTCKLHICLNTVHFGRSLHVLMQKRRKALMISNLALPLVLFRVKAWQ